MTSIERLAPIVLTGVIAAFFGCSKPPARDCPELLHAQDLLDRTSAATLDPTFGDPRYQDALAAFEAIPEDCAQRESAVTVASSSGRAAVSDRF